jgi:TolB-like protein/Tfp pilus assembly protein PilF
MPTSPNKLSLFWQELKRRRVIHVIIVYATVSFVLIELVDIIQEPLLLPAWLLTLVIVLLIVGFPIAVVFSWIYDINSKGITKTEAVKQTIKKKKEDDPPPNKESWFENSIAVLPFEDMSPQKDQEYFCDGITEEIINALTHVESLKVIARTSSFAFKGKHKDMREIGRKLDVETLLEGSIRKDGTRLRITAQLIKVADGSHLWSEKFDRDFKDVFDIQDEISMAIVDHLKVKLLGEVKALIVKRPTENLEAYNHYLMGIYHWQKVTEEGFNLAIQSFQQALQNDSHFALPYYGLAVVYWLSTYFGSMPPNDAYPKIEEYANKALEIDNTLGEAHSIIGLCNTYYYWNWTKAELSFKQGLQLNPNAAYIHIFYSFFLTCTGRHKEAISEAKRARELDPLSDYINAYVAQAYVFDGQFDRAYKETQIGMSINPYYYLSHMNLGYAYAGIATNKVAQGEEAGEEIMKALAAYEKAAELSNGIPFVLSWLAVAYYFFGEKDQSAKLFDSLKERLKSEYVPAMCFYQIYIILDEEDLALEWLERACIEHDSFLPWFRYTSADPVRIPDNPKYTALMKKYGLEK